MLTCTLVTFDGMDLLDAGGPYEVLLTHPDCWNATVTNRHCGS